MATVGLIGLGVLGHAIAERLLACGYRLKVWNRTATRAEDLLAAGACWVEEPQRLAAECDLVLTVVADAPALWEVLTGEHGLAESLAPGAIHCDLSTLDVPTVRELDRWHRQRGSNFVHAPVLGNRHDARAGQLLVFAGGDEAALMRLDPLFGCLSRRRWRWPRPEVATAMKLACNLLLGGMMALLAEALVFAVKAGLEPLELLEVVAESALAAPMYQRKGRALLQGNSTPNFYLSHMYKDLVYLEKSAALGGCRCRSARQSARLSGRPCRSTDKKTIRRSPCGWPSRRGPLWEHAERIRCFELAGLPVGETRMRPPSNSGSRLVFHLTEADLWSEGAR